MFGKRIHLFTLFGFKVQIDVTWLILAVLVTWTLARGLFPAWFPDFTEATYWWMAVAGALGLFGSIIFHEFCHSIIARRFGMQMKGITLFIFGGVAEMQQEPPSSKAELLMAIAGPISSGLIAATCFGLHTLGNTLQWHEPVNGVLHYLMTLNLLLAAFNLIPAFPLDGGRVLRSIIWAAKGNLRSATRISSKLGSAFGLFLIFLGVAFFVSGMIIQGIWFALIGLFIRGASQTSYKQLLIRNALAGEPIAKFMRDDPVTVPPDLTISDLVNDYFYTHHYKMFPVSENGALKGYITTKEVKQIPRDQWSQHTVREVASPCSEKNTVNPHTDATKALGTMNRTGNSRLMVVQGDELVGVVTLKDLLRFLALKVDLQENEDINIPTDT